MSKLNTMINIVKIIGGLFLMAMVAACAQIKVSEYESFRPSLKIEEFFSGSLSAHGVVKNRSGKVIRMFNADIKATWQDGVGTLDEDFVFDDGEIQKRIWKIVPLGAGVYSATAGDVTGNGALTVSGNSMFLKYVLQVPYKGNTLDVKVDDRMYLVNELTLINESTMYKFGFRVGEVILAIQKNQ